MVETSCEDWSNCNNEAGEQALSFSHYASRDARFIMRGLEE